MLEADIEKLIEKGMWVSVTPVMSKGKWAFTCGIYKRRIKTGNWSTINCKTHATPQRCYDWALQILEKQESKRK